MVDRAPAQLQTAPTPAISRLPVGLLKRACACGNHSGSGGECAECRKKREGTLQRAAVHPGPAPEVPPIVQDVLRSPGQPLDASTRAFMEPRFGHDFSGVRVHTDGRAAQSAAAVNARAYTVGPDVVFGAGQYGGEKLLAHELAHVIQQSRGGTRQPSPLPGDRFERDAERAAGAFSSGDTRIQVHEAGAWGIARSPLSITQTLNPRQMSPEARAQEIDEINRWLKDAANRSDTRRADLEQMLTTLSSIQLGEQALNPVASSATVKPKPTPMGELLPPPRTPFEAQAQKAGYRRIRDPQTGQVIGYLYNSGGLTWVVDIEGHGTSIGEIPIESDAISPIDLIPFELVGSLVATAGKLALRSAAKGVGKVVAKEAVKVGAEDVAKAGVDAAAQTALKAGSKAATKDVVENAATSVLKREVLKSGGDEVGKVAAEAATKDVAETAAKDTATTGAKDTATTGSKDATKETAQTAASKPAEPKAHWDLPTDKRGLSIENAIGKLYRTLGQIRRMPKNFKGIDFVSGGKTTVLRDASGKRIGELIEDAMGISEKSLDLRGKVVQTAAGMRGTILKHITQLYEFEAYKLEGIEVRSLKDKMLNIWIGPGKPTAAQLQGVAEAIESAKLNNILINITPF
ncbi:MAG: eCIS core domain-containing protein [Chloroflexia bacterium]